MTTVINEMQSLRFRRDFDELKRSYGDLLLLFTMNDLDLYLPLGDRRRLNTSFLKLDAGIRGLKDELARLAENEVI